MQTLFIFYIEYLKKYLAKKQLPKSNLNLKNLHDIFDFEYFEKNSQLGENYLVIGLLLRYDDIDEFVSFETQTNIPLSNHQFLSQMDFYLAKRHH